MTGAPVPDCGDGSRPLAGRGHGPGRGHQVNSASNSCGGTDGDIMTAPRDTFGRPIVVVTGMGIVTSLGAGKADNWKKLTASECGIRTVTRFPIDGLKSTMAGTVDFVTVEPSSSTGLTERLADIAAEEALAQSGIGRKADFPGPLFLAVAPVEVEWPQRIEVGRVVGKPDFTVDEVLAISGGGQFAEIITVSCSARWPDIWPKVRHQGIADLAVDRLRVGRHRDPLGVEAIRRGETDAALCVATDGSVNQEALIRFSLLSALSTQNDPPQAASKPFSKNRDGFVMAEGAGALVLESYDSAVARGAAILGVVAGCGELTNSFHRTRSSPDGKPIIGCVHKTLDDAGMTPSRSTTSTRTAPPRRKTTRWNFWASPPCSASARCKFRCRRTNR